MAPAAPAVAVAASVDPVATSAANAVLTSADPAVDAPPVARAALAALVAPAVAPTVADPDATKAVAARAVATGTVAIADPTADPPSKTRCRKESPWTWSPIQPESTR